VIPFSLQVGSKVTINKKNRRLSTEIKFPEQDTAANVLELQMNYIPTSER